MTISGAAQEADSLTLGGASGTQTLLIQATDGCSGASNARLQLDDDSAISADGVVELTQSGACGGGTPSLQILGGTLTNGGTIRTDRGPAQSATTSYSPELGGRVVNTGTIDANASAGLYSPYADNVLYLGSLDNRGSVSIAPGVVLGTDSSTTVTNDGGGSITNGTGNGYLSVVGSGATFVQGGGTTSPLSLDPADPAVIVDRANLSYAGSGASSIVLRGDSSLAGAVAAGQNLAIQGYDSCSVDEGADVSVGANMTNDGTIELIQTGACGEGAPRLGIASGATFTNSGTLRIDHGSHQDPANPPDVSGSGVLVNAGAFDVNTSAGFNTTLDNEGKLSLGKAVTVDAESASIIDDAHGLITNGSGTGELSVSHGSYDQGAGKINQTAADPKKPAVSLYNSNLSYTGKGTGTIDVHGEAYESGNLVKGQNIALQGQCNGGGELDARLAPAASFTNGGTITFTHVGDCPDDTIAIDLPSGATLTNTGTLSAVPGSGNPGSTREINGTLVNKGVISCSVPLQINGSSQSSIALTLTPNSGAAGSSFTVTGSGFPPGASVAITFGSTTLPSATADSSGSFSQPETVPSAATGVYQVKAKTQKITAAASFTIH